MSGQFPPKKLSVAILSRLCYLQRRLTGLMGLCVAAVCRYYDGKFRRIRALTPALAWHIANWILAFRK